MGDVASPQQVNMRDCGLYVTENAVALRRIEEDPGPIVGHASRRVRRLQEAGHHDALAQQALRQNDPAGRFREGLILLDEARLTEQNLDAMAGMDLHGSRQGTPQAPLPASYRQHSPQAVPSLSPINELFHCEQDAVQPRSNRHGHCQDPRR